MAFVVFYSSAAAPVAEANFWGERRAAREKSARPAAQYARLPTAAAEINRTLPSITVEKSLSWAPLTRLPESDNESRQASVSRLPKWLMSIPSSYGEIRKVSFSGDSAPVVLIQDVHEVASAQQNVSGLLSHLGETKRLLVGLEGASGGFDLTRYRAFLGAERHAAVSDYLLKGGYITGAEHYGILAEREPELWGVEEPGLYSANVEAYRASLPKKTELETAVADIEGALEAVKERVYSLELWALDKNLSGYHKGEQGLMAHVKYLAGAAGKEAGKLGQVKSLLAALELEEGLDFGRVENERLELIRGLTETLSESALEGLLKQSLSYRLGHVSYGAYYGYLRNLAEENGIRLSDYGTFERYIRYVLLTEKIESAKLFQEVETLKEASMEKLAKTKEQKDLLRLAEDLRLLERMSGHEFGPSEWKSYEGRRGSLARIVERAREAAKAVGVELKGPALAMSETLAPFEAFYAAAAKRNEALVDNLLKKRSPDAATVLIAGGFHTPGLEKILEENGVGYVTFTPKVGKVEDGTKYLDVFTAERTPLEKMMLGEKLYLSPPHALQIALPRGFGHLREVADAAYASASGALAGVDARGEAAEAEALEAVVRELKVLAGRFPRVKIRAHAVRFDFRGRALVDLTLGRLRFAYVFSAPGEPFPEMSLGASPEAGLLRAFGRDASDYVVAAGSALGDRSFVIVRRRLLPLSRWTAFLRAQAARAPPYAAALITGGAAATLLLLGAPLSAAAAFVPLAFLISFPFLPPAYRRALLNLGVRVAGATFVFVLLGCAHIGYSAPRVDAMEVVTNQDELVSRIVDVREEINASAGNDLTEAHTARLLRRMGGLLGEVRALPPAQYDALEALLRDRLGDPAASLRRELLTSVDFLTYTAQRKKLSVRFMAPIVSSLAIMRLSPPAATDEVADRQLVGSLSRLAVMAANEGDLALLDGVPVSVWEGLFKDPRFVSSFVWKTEPALWRSWLAQPDSKSAFRAEAARQLGADWAGILAQTDRITQRLESGAAASVADQAAELQPLLKRVYDNRDSLLARPLGRLLYQRAMSRLILTEFVNDYDFVEPAMRLRLRDLLVDLSVYNGNVNYFHSTHVQYPSSAIVHHPAEAYFFSELFAWEYNAVMHEAWHQLDLLAGLEGDLSLFGDDFAVTLNLDRRVIARLAAPAQTSFNESIGLLASASESRRTLDYVLALQGKPASEVLARVDALVAKADATAAAEAAADSTVDVKRRAYELADAALDAYTGELVAPLDSALAAPGIIGRTPFGQYMVGPKSVKESVGAIVRSVLDGMRVARTQEPDAFYISVWRTGADYLAGASTPIGTHAEFIAYMRANFGTLMSQAGEPPTYPKGAWLAGAVYYHAGGDRAAVRRIFGAINKLPENGGASLGEAVRRFGKREPAKESPGVKLHSFSGFAFVGLFLDKLSEAAPFLLLGGAILGAAFLLRRFLRHRAAKAAAAPDSVRAPPLWRKMALSYAAIGALAFGAYYFGFLSPRDSFFAMFIVNLGTFAFFTGATDFFGQWSSLKPGKKVRLNQLAGMFFKTGPIIGVISMAGLWLISVSIPHLAPLLIFGVPGTLNFLIVNVAAFSLFTGLSNLFDQWRASRKGKPFSRKQLLSAVLVEGPVMGMITWLSFGLINAVSPISGGWTHLIELTLRTIVFMFVVVRARTIYYSARVEKYRREAGEAPVDAEEAKLSQEKQTEGFWVARLLSYFKNFIILAFVPLPLIPAVEAIVNQFFQLFYTWSVNKDGFIVGNERLRRNKIYLMLFPFFYLGVAAWGRYRWMIDQQSLPDGVSSLVKGMKPSIVRLAGLKFLRFGSREPRVRILVIEPLDPMMIAEFQRKVQEAQIDLLLPESELEKRDGLWKSAVHTRLKRMVSENRYDYVVGYVNAKFDKEFFEGGRLKGLTLISTGVHNIDFEAAAAAGTLVTNAAGPTTGPVAEELVGFALDANYSGKVAFDGAVRGWPRLEEAARSADADDVAQLLWYGLMRRSLKLDKLFEFGMSGRYARTGVGSNATVYHHKLGQHREDEAIISLGIAGLDEAGLRLAEIAVAHEMSTIYVLENEYDDLKKERLERMIEAARKASGNEGLIVRVLPVDEGEFERLATFKVRTPGAAYYSEGLDVDPLDIYVAGDAALRGSLRGLTVGLLGLGRIGEAIVQRLAAFGVHVVVNQRDNQRDEYVEKADRLARFAEHFHEKRPEQPLFAYEEKESFLRKSHMVIIASPINAETRGWISEDELEIFGADAEGGPRALLAATQNVIRESALIPYLRDNRSVQARLDVVAKEYEGDAHRRFSDESGRPLPNIRLSGHTAAAVWEMRQAKVRIAMRNLRQLIGGLWPDYLLEKGRRAVKPEGPAAGRAAGTKAERVARAEGALRALFDLYLTDLRATSRRARMAYDMRSKELFQSADVDRRGLFPHYTNAAVGELSELLGEMKDDPAVWREVRAMFDDRVSGRYEIDIAETFFDSVFQRFFPEYVVNVESFRQEFVAETAAPGPAPMFRTFSQTDMGDALAAVLDAYPVDVPYFHRERDLEIATAALEGALREAGVARVDGLDMAKPIFYRGKAAYIVGRIRAGPRSLPIVLSLSNTDRGVVFDAVFVGENAVSPLFSYTRSSFHVETDRYHELVAFLKQVMPRKKESLLYFTLGFPEHAESKLLEGVAKKIVDAREAGHRFTEFDRGRDGLLTWFSIPNMDLRFLVPRDEVGEAALGGIEKRYEFVHEIDRLGRLIDTLPFENLRFPRDLFDETLLAALLKASPGSVRVEGQDVVFRRVLTQRKSVPLAEYLAANPDRAPAVLEDLGSLLRELAMSNIYLDRFDVGNFGVMDTGRVVAFDFSGMRKLTDVTIGAGAFDPAGLPAEIFGGDARWKELFLARHEDLATPIWWKTIQAIIRDERRIDFVPAFKKPFLLQAPEDPLATEYRLAELHPSVLGRQVAEELGLVSMASRHRRVGHQTGNAYHNEDWGAWRFGGTGKDVPALFQLGALFVIDENAFQALSLDTRRLLLPQAVRIRNLGGTALFDAETGPSTIAVLLAMKHEDFAGRSVVVRSDDELIALVAARSGAARVALLSRPGGAKETDNLAINGLEAGRNFFYAALDASADSLAEILRGDDVVGIFQDGAAAGRYVPFLQDHVGLTSVIVGSRVGGSVDPVGSSEWRLSRLVDIGYKGRGILAYVNHHDEPSDIYTQVTAEAYGNIMTKERPAPAARAAVPEIDPRETVAWEMLTVLGLTDGLGEPLTGAPAGMTVRRVTASSEDAARAPLAMKAFRTELGEAKAYDLVYNGERLIAVFPRAEGARPGPQADLWGYFNFAPYYFLPPAPGAPDAAAAWEDFLARKRADERLIRRYQVQEGLVDRVEKIDYSQSEYVYLEADLETGEVEMKSFDAEDYKSVLEEFSRSDGKRRVIAPVFPTVYSPAHGDHKFSDIDFHREILQGEGIRVGRGGSFAVVGPGSGIDTWLAWLRTGGRAHVIGVNPFEVANAKALARLAGYEVAGLVADNIADAEGRPHFDDGLFDLVLWNMPLHRPGSPVNEKLINFWDGDPSGTVLKRFANGLLRALSPEGRAMVWNTRSDAVRAVFDDTGLEVSAKDIRDHSYQLYYVSRPASSVGAYHRLAENSLQSLWRLFVRFSNVTGLYYDIFDREKDATRKIGEALLRAESEDGHHTGPREQAPTRADRRRFAEVVAKLALADFDRLNVWTRQVFLEGFDAISRLFVRPQSAEDLARIRAAAAALDVAREKGAGAQFPEVEFHGDFKFERLSADGRRAIFRFRVGAEVRRVDVQVAKGLPLGALMADDGTHVAATISGPPNRGPVAAFLVKLPFARFFVRAPLHYTITLQPDALQTPGLLYRVLVEELQEIRLRERPLPGRRNGLSFATAHDRVQRVLDNRANLAFDVARVRARRDYSAIVPPAGKQVLPGEDEPARFRDREQMERNASLLFNMEAVGAPGFAGFDTDREELDRVLDHVKKSSLRNLPADSPEGRRFLRFHEALGRASRAYAEAYQENPAEAKKKFEGFAWKAAFLSGAASGISPQFGEMTRSWIESDLLAARDLVSESESGADQARAVRSLFDAGAKLALEDAGLRKDASYVTLNDLRGEMAENLEYLSDVGKNLARRFQEDESKGLGDAAVLLTDRAGADELRAELLRLRWKAGRDGDGIQKLLDNWKRVTVVTTADLRAQNALREARGGTFVVDLAAMLETPLMKARAAGGKTVRIVTGDPTLWFTGGLPADRAGLVEFLLWVARDGFFKARKADIEGMLEAIRVLNVQA